MDEHEKRFGKIEARLRQLESFLGHSWEDPDEGEKKTTFHEFPKAVGDRVVYSEEEEREAARAHTPELPPAA